ncbi:ABC-type dipeptide/oligopeptide/nickel transport system permease subunit [Catenulispora sp. GP43]|jgi:ABC-type dipeptide/oligopeptide/nickel transport system permease subunit|uniref:hydrophobic protein n=1 Tax=Catenulispora sp. GP43 TaxID=3156263 RepID=UPI0035138C08
MGVILLVLLLALVLGGLGFAAHVLWIIAAIVFLAWLVGFGISRGEAAGSGGRRRWYGRW